MAGASVTNNIGDFINGRDRAITKLMHKVLIVGGSHASLFTPIDTSTLLNSAYREVKKEGNVIKGTYGYRANYAKYVNDPNIRQRFRRATAKKEFLKLGFEEAKPIIDSIVANELRV